MFCGFPLGAAFGGFLAAWMIPQWGWRSVLVLGGITPLVLFVLLLLLMPESVRFLVVRRATITRIRGSLRRLGGASVDQIEVFTLTETRPVTSARGGLAQVVGRPYLLGSVMLWIAYFMGLVIFYALINWMPLLFKDAGLDQRTATLISALFPLGGIGAVFFGWLMDRFQGDRIVAVGYALTAVFVWAIGQAVGEVGLLVLVVFVAGTLMNTAQSSLPALAAAFYPTSGRASGVSWMLGIGRFGGILGSFLVAQLTAAHVALPNVFAIVAVAGLLSAGALWIKSRNDPAGADGAAARERTAGAVLH
jgi:AAHS family 4-hydroxybenzoate transporter-like MFS transporter